MKRVIAVFPVKARRLIALVTALALALALGLGPGPAAATIALADAGDHCAGPRQAPEQPKRPDCCLGAACLMHCALPLPPAAPIAAGLPDMALTFVAGPLQPASGRQSPPPLPPPRSPDRA